MFRRRRQAQRSSGSRRARRKAAAPPLFVNEPMPKDAVTPTHGDDRNTSDPSRSVSQDTDFQRDHPRLDGDSPESPEIIDMVVRDVDLRDALLPSPKWRLPRLDENAWR